MIQKRADAGDPMGIYYLAAHYNLGLHGLKKDVTRGVELLERAVELGVKDAHYTLGYLYNKGVDVERDTARAIRHLEAAAISGHVLARGYLGCTEWNAGNNDLALQHFLISAKLGDEQSLNTVKDFFMHGGPATKTDYAEALRGYQSAVEDMRSPDRDEARVDNTFKTP